MEKSIEVADGKRTTDGRRGEAVYSMTSLGTFGSGDLKGQIKLHCCFFRVAEYPPVWKRAAHLVYSVCLS